MALCPICGGTGRNLTQQHGCWKCNGTGSFPDAPRSEPTPPPLAPTKRSEPPLPPPNRPPQQSSPSTGGGWGCLALIIIGIAVLNSDSENSSTHRAPRKTLPEPIGTPVPQDSWTAPEATSTPQAPPPTETVTEPFPSEPMPSDETHEFGAGSACLRNNTDVDISYFFRWGQSKWEKRTISTGENRLHWWKHQSPENSSPTLQIIYDADLSDKENWQTRTLKRYSVSLPATCEAARLYSFVRQGIAIGLESDIEAPDWPKAFPPITTAELGANAACLQNRTEGSISYLYRWGRKEWKRRTLPVGETWWHSRNYKGDVKSSPPLQIMYDANLTDQENWQTRTLTPRQVSLPITCEAARPYSFVRRNDVVGLESTIWQPNWPHAFAQSVIAAEEENVWTPAPGYRWFDPANYPDDLGVVEEDVGIVGIVLGKEELSDVPMVLRVVKNSPAAQTGITPGLEILSVDGKTTASLSLKDCTLLIKGSIGNIGRLEFRDPKSSKNFTVELERR